MVTFTVLAFIASIGMYLWLIKREYEVDSTMFWASLIEDQFVVRRLFNGDAAPGSWWIFIAAVGFLILSFVLLWL